MRAVALWLGRQITSAVLCAQAGACMQAAQQPACWHTVVQDGSAWAAWALSSKLTSQETAWALELTVDL